MTRHRCVAGSAAAALAVAWSRHSALDDSRPRHRRPDRRGPSTTAAPTGTGCRSQSHRVNLSSPAWTSPTLDGELYGEPLVSGGQVFVATENDTVYALSATTGAVVWSTHLGTPVPSSIAPLRRHLPHRRHHRHAGDRRDAVRALRGGRRAGQRDPGARAGRAEHRHREDRVDPGRRPGGLDPGRAPAAHRPDARRRPGRLRLRRQLRRLLHLPRVGDLGARGGWHPGRLHRRLGVRARARVPCGWAVRRRWWTPAATSGSSAGNGSVYSSSHAYDDSDSVLELSPSLTLLQYFAPSSWPADNAHDLDMSTAPALLGRPGRGGRQVAHRLPAQRVQSGWHRGPGGELPTPAAATSTAASPSWGRPSTCPA